MRRVISIAALFISALLVLSACKSPQNSAIGNAPESPAAKVTALLDQAEHDKAVDVAVHNQAFFERSLSNPEVSAVIDRLVSSLDLAYSPQVDEIQYGVEKVLWPATSAQWFGVKAEMQTLDDQVSALRQTPIFRNPLFRPSSVDRAIAAYSKKADIIRADAPKQFANYPLTQGDDFFAAYPVDLNTPVFLMDNRAVWQQAVEEMSREQFVVFLKTYGKSLPPEAQDELGQKYFQLLCPNPNTANLKEILSAYEQCKEAGITLSSIPGIKIAFLQVTSPDLIKNKALDFGVNVKLDMPFEASKASMRKAFTHEAVKEADVLILVNIAVSKAKRVVARQEGVRSTFIAGYAQEVNPEYEIAKSEMDSATAAHSAAKNKEVTPWLISMTMNLMEESAKEDLVESTGQNLLTAKEKFRSTPKYISVAEYQPYQVTKAHMDISKFATVHYYVVDKRKGKFFKDTFDISQKSFFTVCYAMQESDPNRSKFLETSVLEEDVVRYELEPAVVNLSDLLDQFVSRPAEAVKYASMGDVHRAFTADRSAAQVARKNETYGYDKYADKRFDSVVLVRNTGTGIGTGFYVTDDMIMTNYHVVEESQYVQLKMFNEREMMGRVVARDAHLDLALIQADVRGKPVCFYDKRELPLGETLEMIGHPNGLEFSITRGVISSIRKTPPVNFRESNSDVLYIQTDAASNGGNSGGPVFYGNYVVGVHDWGIKKARPDVPAQGLNFSIHYSEVFKFLNDHKITVCKGSK